MKNRNEEHYGLGSPGMLEKIDKLFALNLGELVDLPQIVVVGDQSSGKSSVIEGLINKPLPRDSGLCTRFATQIIFRRSEQENIFISIIPDANATQDHKDRVKGWSKDGLTSLDSSSFTKMMSEAHEVMGLGQHQDGSSDNSPFSNDVLRLEISGQKQEHLSVIDVPGIFKNTTVGLTTKADILLVRNMVLGYMENPRSVMLTVVPANVDVATQEILELAADVDPDGHRTLGVLTKPDLVDKGAESRVMDLIAGKSHPLTLGWHLVRNPGQQQLSNQSLDRRALEANFFRVEAPWKSLGKDKVGIESLRGRLQEVLSSLVRREFPKVKKEISRKLALDRTKLRSLGMERESPETQSAYLMDLSTRFQRLVSLSVSAKYGSDELFDEDVTLRLATSVVARNLELSDELSKWGQEYQFNTTENGLELQEEENQDQQPPGLKLKSGSDTSAQNNKVFEVRKYMALPELDDILHAQESLQATHGDSIALWLRKVYETSRGFELGTFDSSILCTTMKKQSAKWNSIALGYISDIVAITHHFINKTLEAICDDPQVRGELLATLTDGLMDRYRRAIDQVRFLLNVERAGTPMTLNHFFNDNLEKYRQKRMQNLMSRISIRDSTHGTVVRLEEMVHHHSMSNTQHVVQDLHDILFSYYQVACKRFVDNLCMHAADHFLISGPETPLNLFSPTFVNSLTAEQLEMIAGEDQGTKRIRGQLRRDIRRFEKAKQILI